MTNQEAAADESKQPIALDILEPEKADGEGSASTLLDTLKPLWKVVSWDICYFALADIISFYECTQTYYSGLLFDWSQNSMRNESRLSTFGH